MANFGRRWPNTGQLGRKLRPFWARFDQTWPTLAKSGRRCGHPLRGRRNGERGVVMWLVPPSGTAFAAAAARHPRPLAMDGWMCPAGGGAAGPQKDVDRGGCSWPAPTSVDSGPLLAELGPIRANFGRTRANPGLFWSIFSRTQARFIVDQIPVDRNSGQPWATWRDLAQI